jgi:hypothetical protein
VSLCVSVMGEEEEEGEQECVVDVARGGVLLRGIRHPRDGQDRLGYVDTQWGRCLCVCVCVCVCLLVGVRTERWVLAVVVVMLSL